MESNDVQMLMQIYHNRLAFVDGSFHRYLFNEIDWRDRLIGIKGQRGVGKTTLMLQHIKESFENPDDAFYVSLDDFWFASHRLEELVSYLYAQGVRYLFVDEVHHYDSWQTILKNLYDGYPDLHIAYTGSSMLLLETAQGDLSRRLIDYTLPGLSFREFLSYEGVADIPAVSWDDLLSRHVQIAMSVKEKIPSIMPLFDAYLRHGYYPFYKEVSRGFELRLQHVASRVLEMDYPKIDDVSVSTINKTRKMLMVLAEHVPQVPTMSKLYGQLETDRNQGLKMLYALQRAGLIALLTDNTKSLKTLARPEKILIDNTNLMYVLGAKIEVGTVRETFFFNQVRHVLPVVYPAKGDFLVDGKYLFEVGGMGKTFEQIKDEPDSFLAVDDTEIGHKNRIPLWMFGLLY